MTSLEQMKKKDPDPYVHITKTGKYYHEMSCGKLKFSNRRVRLSTARQKGLTACPYDFKADPGIIPCIIFGIILFFGFILSML